jgi:xylulokinase
MLVLAIDVGSSAVKAAILRGTRVVGRIARVEFPTKFDEVRAEIEPRAIFRAIADAISQLGAAAKRLDAIAPAVMSPAWVAMDKHGHAITPIVTHQDRRSVAEAAEIERRIGKRKHLKLAGNRPFPGGISSTTFLWFAKHEPSLMRRADLVGHLNTLLHARMTGARVIDPSNASFTGLYRTLNQSGWSDELCDAVGVSEHQLPQLVSADGVGGMINHAAGREFGLTHGTPMVVGLIDTSAAMLLAGARNGQVLNVCGSTDVLAVATAKPQPDGRLLTRALGVGKMWMSVSTLAAAGSALLWARRELFRDLSEKEFWRLARRRVATNVRFDPYLAGERASMQIRRGAFANLTLATTREEMLAAIGNSLVEASAARVDLLREVNRKLLARVVVSGGVQDGLGDLMRRDWKGKWTFKNEPEATLRGLGLLVD